MYRDACLSKIKSILRKSSCVCIVLMGKYSASHASWASPLRKARTRTAMHGTFEAQARRAAEQTVGNRGYSIIACDWHARRNLHRLCFLSGCPRKRGAGSRWTSAPPESAAAGFALAQNQACAHRAHPQNRGGSRADCPLFLTFVSESRFSERSAYLEIGNTTVPPRPYAAAYAGEETAVSSVRPKDTYRASLTCFIVRSSKWPIFSFRRRLSIVRICSSRMTEFFASPPSV